MDAGGRATHGAVAERTQNRLIVFAKKALRELCVFAVKAMFMDENCYSLSKLPS
jgi:hypothetical protein